MESSAQRRTRRLLELINLEGGLDRGKGGTPGHYRIAQRVIDFEDSAADPAQMAQALRQVVNGKKKLGDKNVTRIELAYQDARLHGVRLGWFDNPLLPDASALATKVTVEEKEGPTEGVVDPTPGIAMQRLRAALNEELRRNVRCPASVGNDLFWIDYASGEFFVMLLLAPSFRQPSVAWNAETFPVWRSIVRLAAHRAEKQDAGRRYLIAIMTGKEDAGSFPLQPCMEASALGIEILLFESPEHLAHTLNRWDK